jgi:hypothetical protein
MSLQGQISWGKEGFWWRWSLREKSSLSQGEITLLFGKRTVHENRCSCKAKSRGEKKVSGGQVVVQRGREFHQQAPSSREQFFAVAEVSPRAKRRANPHWSRLGYLAPIQLLHALLVGVVAEALARNRQAAQFCR